MDNQQVSFVEDVHSPRDYQLEAKQAIWSAFHAGDMGALLVMATGLGKTLTAAWFTSEWLLQHPGQRVLFLVHTVDAARQARKKFGMVFKDGIVTGFMGDSERENPDARMVFAVFATMQNQLHDYPVEDFGLVIVDEAHHSQADTYHPVIKAFPNAFRFGMTATPNRMDGRDIRDIFGDPVYSHTLERALAEGKWLAEVNYKVCNANIDIVALRKLIKRVNGGDRTVSRDQINKSIFLGSEIEQVATQVIDQQSEETHTIVFCSSVEHASEVVNYFPSAETYHTGVSVRSGEESPLDRFRKGTTKTIIVVDKLNEAIDVPEADLIVFWRSTNSRRIWLQQLGRGLRRSKDKQHVTVLDFVANCNRLMSLHEMDRAVRSITDKIGADKDRPESMFIGLHQFQMSFTTELVDLVNMLELSNIKKLTYIEARAMMHAVEPRVTTMKEYRDVCKKIHPDLPRYPDKTYKNKGWIDPYNFLGPGALAKKLPFAKARAVVHAFEPTMTTKDGWTHKEILKEYRRRREEIHPGLPHSPNQVYFCKGWIDWYDFLGKLWFNSGELS